MSELMHKLFDQNGFMARRYCGNWTSEQVLFHNVSDAIIWIAYMTIPAVLIYFVHKKRGNLPFPRMFWMFGAFIILCGMTHFMDIVMFYKPLYNLSGLLKAVTAAVSLMTAIALVPLVPKALAMRTSEELEHEIAARKWATARLQETHTQLVEISRRAGMAEVATTVLHNVGNVLNSVNVSANLVSESLRKSKLPGLQKAARLMNEQAGNLGQFFAGDPRGKQLPGYLEKLGEHLGREQSAMLEELRLLSKHIEHINEIVSMQQAYARVTWVAESVSPAELVEDALRMNSRALAWHDVEVIRQFEMTSTVSVEKHKVLQVLVNLISNAKYALDDGSPAVRQMTLTTGMSGNNRFKISVGDNGVGILAENLTRIFAHGFTTKKTGHGFGLHSSALAAKQLGGTLSVHSDGPGKGAIFTLELPLNPGKHPNAAQQNS